MELHTKHDFLIMQINKKGTNFFGSYLHRMFIEYSKEYTGTLHKFEVLDFLQMKSLFYNKGGRAEGGTCPECHL